jgi:hypothetical protein
MTEIEQSELPTKISEALKGLGFGHFVLTAVYKDGVTYSFSLVGSDNFYEMYEAAERYATRIKPETP